MAKNLSEKVARSMYLNLLPAQILAAGILNINSLLNSLLIGNLMGTDYLAVFGFIGPLNCVHTMIGGGIAAGMQILCGQDLGRGEKKGICRTCSAVFILCIALGLLLTAAYQIFPEQIASLLGASGEAKRITADYLRGFGWGVIFMFLSSCMIPFLQLNNASHIMYIAVGVMTAANAGFDLLSILVFKTGMRAIGLASVGAYLLSDLVVMGYYFSKKCPIRFSLSDFRPSSVRSIFHMGLPSISQPFFLIFRNLTFNNVAVRVGGVAAVTSMAIYGNIALIIDSFGSGIANATNMTASVFHGARDKESLRTLTPITLKVNAMIEISLYALVFLLAKPLARLFGAQGELIPLAATAIRIGFLYLVLNTVTDSIQTVYKGIGRTRIGNIYNFVNYMLIPVSFCLLASRLIGVNGVWLSYAVPEPLCLIGLVIYAARMRGQRLKKVSDLTYIPESFGVESQDRCDASIRNIDEAMDASRRAIAFCRGKGMDERKSKYCGLCIEELAIAILEHGAERNRKNRRGEIDLRMIYENGGISIMLRDNFLKLDIVDWMRLHEPEDPMRYIGIRMVDSFASEVNYSTTLNLNVLTLRV